MNKLSYHLILVNSSLRVLIDQIANVVYKLKKKDMIKTKRRGIYIPTGTIPKF